MLQLLRGIYEIYYILHLYIVLYIYYILHTLQCALCHELEG